MDKENNNDLIKTTSAPGEADENKTAPRGKTYTELTIEKMNENKEKLGLTYKKISELTGVPVGTVQKVLGGFTDSPRTTTMHALTELLLYEKKKEDPLHLRSYYYPDYRMGENFKRDMELCNLVAEANPYLINKSSSAWKLKDGSEPLKTIDDYYKESEFRRIELIQGVFYDMAAPTATHQMFVTEILGEFRNHVIKNKGTCLPLAAPVDVQLNEDNITMVEPDILILCDKDKLRKNKIFGAPDLTVEIVSKSSGSYDRITKLSQYMNAGVREYWIIDTFTDEILVYFFEESYAPKRYGFNDKVPVNIWNGECVVNFEEIMTRLAPFMEDDSSDETTEENIDAPLIIE